MSEKKKGITVYACIGLMMAIAVAALDKSRGYGWLHMLCDGCFVAAVMLLGFGGLKIARNQGTFDIMTYSIKSVFQLHYPFTKMDSPLQDRGESFADYKERKREERKPAAEPLWAGLGFLVLAAIFFATYLLTTGA